VRSIWLWLIVVTVLVAVFAVYRFRSGGHLNVAPDAQREIEKARSR